MITNTPTFHTPDALLEASQWDFFWLPEDARVVDRPELLYCHTPRNVVGLNVVTRLRAGGRREIEALVAEVTDAHSAVHSRWMVVPASHSPQLETVLATAGYSPGPTHVVCTIEPHRYVPRPVAPGVQVREVDSLDSLKDWIRVSEEAFGRTLPGDDAYLTRELDACTRPGARSHRFVAYADGRPVSAAGFGVYPALSLGFFWAGGTIPDARGRGAYSALVAARLERARTLGLSRVGLYAREDTAAPIVARQGFDRHGWMIFWERPAPGGA